VKACIFDLDGVIVDTAKYHFLAWQKLALELGVTLTEADNEQLKGIGRMESLNIILAMAGIVKSVHEKEVLSARKNDWFKEYILAMSKDEIFPGAKNLFNELKTHGIKLAVASSSKNAPAVLEKLEVENEFEVIVDGTMIQNSKPDPEIFLKAAILLREDPADCVVIEDAEAGVEAAMRAGMQCVGVGKVQQLSKANAVVDKIDKLNFKFLTSLS
jgi:beta-phosphoglucomutase